MTRKESKVIVMIALGSLFFGDLRSKKALLVSFFILGRAKKIQEVFSRIAQMDKNGWTSGRELRDYREDLRQFKWIGVFVGEVKQNLKLIIGSPLNESGFLTRHKSIPEFLLRTEPKIQIGCWILRKYSNLFLYLPGDFLRVCYLRG